MPAGHGIYWLLYQLITGEFSWLSECQAAVRHQRLTLERHDKNSQ